MKKVELVEAVAEKAGLTKADATRAIDATFEAILKELHVKDVILELVKLLKLKLEMLFHLKQDLLLKTQ